MKYALEQVVYYLKDNRLHSAPIMSRMVVENARQEKAYTSTQEEVFCRFGKAGTFYATIHGTFRESEVFPTKEALASRLIEA